MSPSIDNFTGGRWPEVGTRFKVNREGAAEINKSLWERAFQEGDEVVYQGHTGPDDDPPSAAWLRPPRGRPFLVATNAAFFREMITPGGKRISGKERG